MTQEQLTGKIDPLVQNYLFLGESVATIVRQLKKTPNAELRSQLLRELRNLAEKQLILNQIDECPRA